MVPVVDENAIVEPGRQMGLGEGPRAPLDRGAEPPRAPALSRSALEGQEERARYVLGQETRERRSLLRGLILLCLVILVASLIHAGGARTFPAGWLRRW